MSSPVSMALCLANLSNSSAIFPFVTPPPVPQTTPNKTKLSVTILKTFTRHDGSSPFFNFFVLSCAQKETVGKVVATAASSYGNGLAGAIVVTMPRGVHRTQHYRFVSLATTVRSLLQPR